MLVQEVDITQIEPGMRIWNKDETQQGFITQVYCANDTFDVKWENGYFSHHLWIYPLSVRFVEDHEQKQKWFRSLPKKSKHIKM